MWTIIILANLPLPIIAYLNWRVTMRYLRVRKLAKDVAIERPHRFTLGWWLSNLAIIFIVIPPLAERRLFVENPAWLLCYAAAAGLTIGGLLLMNGALGVELKQLARLKRPKAASTPVDTKAPDTL